MHPATALVYREYFARTECADTAGPTIKSHFSDEAWQRRASQKFVCIDGKPLCISIGCLMIHVGSLEQLWVHAGEDSSDTRRHWW